MDAYLFQGALFCPTCAKEIKADTKPPAGVDPAKPDESLYDSDDYPKGPYPNGGGEADSPQHCDRCAVFLQSPLTSDGMAYVREQVADGHDLHASDGALKITWRNPVVKEWAEYYGVRPSGDA